MSRQKIFTPLSLAVFLALLVAAVTPLAALAQDEAPPQPDAPVVVVEEPVAEEPAVEESAAEEIIVSEVLEQLPEDTGLVVLDEEGEVLPLASTEAAEVIAAPDPYFTVGGVTYRFFGAAGACGVTPNCWDGSATPIQDAIDYLSTILKASPDNGNVYVEAGTYSEDVYVSGADWLADGGSVPLSLGIIGAGSGSTTLNGLFSILGMNAFTLSGFTVNTVGGGSDSIDVINGNGTLSLTDLVVTNDNEEASGIRVENTGNVSLDGVVSTTMGTGIFIETSNGDAILKDVVANGNSFDGVFLRVADGNLTLTDVTANDNGFNGATIDVTNGNTNVLCGSYSDNGDYGLWLDLSGNAHLGGPILTGNGLGEYRLVNGTVTFGPCGQVKNDGAPLGEGGERGFKPQNNLSDDPLVCNGEKKVSLENGDAFGMYENLCDVDFQLQKETEPPGQLSTQLGILNVQLTSGGIAQSKLPLNGRITLKFPIPRDADENGLVVLFWDGSAWVEVSGGRVIDGFYVIEATQPGIYALTSR
jgi:hypothetical protein